ncbi:hypothetical protein FLCU109888_11590 [Flavobacterium cucumis]|uniref:Uncharacterized protein n=1 Tax=Flavobacterium cucumis TaxID=416016 RepID=A0A1M7ZVQ5_9FLAO|nr:hypothetical protein SAMN05443547_1238 [Flavobacterium cucumis]
MLFLTKIYKYRATKQKNPLQFTTDFYIWN